MNSNPLTAALPRGLEALIWAPSTPFTRWLERWRYVFFIGLVVLILVPFNGQWRMGLDSSIYRGVADSLATGHGYTFAGRAQTQIYPGLPFLLAMLQKLGAGVSVVPALVIMTVLAIATIAMTYELIRLRYPIWIAVIVACGVGLNERFVQQAQEVMTDTPFLFGCITAMLGWERLSLAKSRRDILISTGLLIVGLFVAATMRPTFWVLAAAWGVSALWAVLRYRDRRSMIALGSLLLVLAAFVLLDPRFHGVNLLQGAYEKQFIQNLSSRPGDVSFFQRIKDNGGPLLTHELPEAFFAEPLAWLGRGFSIALLVGAALVSWRQPVWGLQVFILSGVMLLLSDVPRYYLMVLPTLWLGYVLLMLVLFQAVSLVKRDVLLFLFISLANFMNIAAVFSLIHEQHSADFLATYKHGTYRPDVQMAQALNKLMTPTDIAIGPRGQLLSFLSGRNVLNGKLLGFETQGITKQPALIAAATPKYLIGPASAYETKDPGIYRLLMHGVVTPGKLVQRLDPVDGTEPMWIALAHVNVPTADWRTLPIARPRPIADRPTRIPLTQQEIERRARKVRLQIRQARADRAARNLRKARRLHQQQSTPPATRPVSMAVPLPDWCTNNFVDIA